MGAIPPELINIILEYCYFCKECNRFKFPHEEDIICLDCLCDRLTKQSLDRWKKMFDSIPEDLTWEQRKNYMGAHGFT